MQQLLCYQIGAINQHFFSSFTRGDVPLGSYATASGVRTPPDIGLTPPVWRGTNFLIVRSYHQHRKRLTVFNALFSRLVQWLHGGTGGPCVRSRQRITFKTAVIVFKCLHGQDPLYLTELCRPISSDAGHRHLRSAFTRRLIVARTKISYGDRSFSVHGPSVGTVCRTTCGYRTCR